MCVVLFIYRYQKSVALLHVSSVGISRTNVRPLNAMIPSHCPANAVRVVPEIVTVSFYTYISVHICIHLYYKSNYKYQQKNRVEIKLL